MRPSWLDCLQLFFPVAESNLPDLALYVDRARGADRTGTLGLGDGLELLGQRLEVIGCPFTDQTQVTSVHLGLPIAKPELLKLIFDSNI